MNADIAKSNRYTKIIEEIFCSRYTEGSRRVDFERRDIENVARQLGIELPKNIGDILYSFRYRAALPPAITDCAPEGQQWIIIPAGISRYSFVTTQVAVITPNEHYAETKIPDATPGIIGKYALNDEQALLAKLRYNRLIDIFTGVTCYSLQSHLRTVIPDMGQVETDEVYVGIDKRGAHYVFPVQAKGGKDKLNIVQIIQDFALGQTKFPGLICRPIASQFMADDLIALFEFEQSSNGFAISCEKHYRLVTQDQILPEDLISYQRRS